MAYGTSYLIFPNATSGLPDFGQLAEGEESGPETMLLK